MSNREELEALGEWLMRGAILFTVAAMAAAVTFLNVRDALVLVSNETAYKDFESLKLGFKEAVLTKSFPNNFLFQSTKATADLPPPLDELKLSGRSEISVFHHERRGEDPLYLTRLVVKNTDSADGHQYQLINMNGRIVEIEVETTGVENE